MTPHINAKKEDIAKIVLMPGDPLRAKFIAEKYLKKVKLVNEVRGMLAYTGYYNDKKVTVMGHGMGIPSIGIYSYELFNFYDVEVIIRIGSTGAYLQEMNLGDIVVASQAISDSCYANNLDLNIKKNRIDASKIIYDLAIEALNEKQIKYYDGLVLSSDAFYGYNHGKYINKLLKDKKILSVEMEAFALYANAIKLNKKALTLLTVSDSIPNKLEMSSQERQTSFINMMETAFLVVEKWYDKNN